MGPGERRQSDAEVVAASVEDPATFGLLIHAHGLAVHRYLQRRVGTELAEDLAAETFLRAFRSRKGYVPLHDTALPWLYGIATNVLRGHTRSEQRRLEVLGRIAAQAAYEDGVERVDDALDAAATVQRFALAFGALSGDARDVLTLVGVERLSYEEAGTAIGIPVGTVRSRLSRARHDLRAALRQAPSKRAERKLEELPNGAPHGR